MEPDVDPSEEMRALWAAAHRPDANDHPFEVDGQRMAPARVVKVLQAVMTEPRIERIREVVAGRTRTVVPVVEGLINTGNVSAVLRSAEALGYQAVHLVRGANERFKHSERTSRGAEKWLDLVRWDDPAACVNHLHNQGYTVVATHLDDTAVPIDTIDFTERTALVFGNEHRGVSPDMLAAADRRCIIPLDGFTESFNVSVAAAVALYHARSDRLRRQGVHADLTEAEQTALMARFCMRSVRDPEALLRRALQE